MKNGNINIFSDMDVNRLIDFSKSYSKKNTLTVTGLRKEKEGIYKKPKFKEREKE